ncbi:MAG: single-stranded DNA-binding protein [Selenomonadaceae bacterium]
MLNNITLIGRTCAEPESRYLPSGALVVRFTLAVTRNTKGPNGEKQTDFIRCSAWNKTAEFVEAYVGKGRLIAVEGELHINSTTQADGSRRDYTEVTCRRVQPLDYAKDDQQQPDQPAPVSDIDTDDCPFN